MEIFYATRNEGKIRSLQRHLHGSGITVIAAPLDIPEPRSDDVKEIAVAKVRYAHQHLQKPVVALDAGFYISSLNGFPRAFVNFALETVGLEGILKLVEDKSRDCEFRECLAYVDGIDSEPRCFMGRVPGSISSKQHGLMAPHLWSTLALIFVPEGCQKTLAQMSYDEYADVRSRATRKNPSVGKLFSEWIMTKTDITDTNRE
ncbi:hypothetical protein HZB03_01640 [Candidatus Woesearchaeota archaeon]|nr:hypothetical protein [Candidatus Woesearchaeota archaeon]